MRSSTCRRNQCGTPRTQIQLKSKNENLLTVTSHFTELPIATQNFPIECGAVGATCNLLQFIVYNETGKWFACVMEWGSFKLHSLNGRDGHCRSIGFGTYLHGAFELMKNGGCAGRKCCSSAVFAFRIRIRVFLFVCWLLIVLLSDSAAMKYTLRMRKWNDENSKR